MGFEEWDAFEDVILLLCVGEEEEEEEPNDLPASMRPLDTPEYRTLSSCSTFAKIELPNLGTMLSGLLTSIHTKP